MDTRGRRRILLRTIPILIFSMILTAVCVGLRRNHIYEENSIWDLLSKWGALLFMVIFLFTYSSGLATIPWLINSEIYPLFLISSASALSAFSNWMTNFTVVSLFQNSNQLAVISGMSCINVLFFVFVFYFVKETKGNSVRQNVALMLNKT